MMTSLDGKIMGKYMETPELDENAPAVPEGDLSVVVAASADGSTDTPALFSAKGGVAPEMPVSFALQSAEVRDGGSVWLRYLVKDQEEFQMKKVTAA